MSWFCKHNWQILVNKFLESNAERVLRECKENSNYNKIHIPLTQYDMKSTHVVIMSCTRCGKLDKTVTTT